MRFLLSLLCVGIASVAIPTRLRAAIPLIRDAPIDLQGALANDFEVAQQNPYSADRNKVLSVSPSTGTEQLYEISLPDSGGFQLYQSAFDNVAVSSPAAVVKDRTALSDRQIQMNLSSFSIRYENNKPVEATLADGARAEFDDGKIVVRSPTGQILETLSTKAAAPQPLAQTKSTAPQQLAQRQARENGRCEKNIRNKFYEMSVAVSSGAKTLEQAQSDYGKLMVWILTFGAKSLEDSTVPNSRNLTFQSVACRPPVTCNEPQTYEGGSEIRTDLFRLPKGTNPSIALEYEFFVVPDRIEMMYDGQIIFDVGPAAGSDRVQIHTLPNDATYVGVKVIGNKQITSTRWWYTLFCGSEFAPPP